MVSHYKTTPHRTTDDINEYLQLYLYLLTNKYIVGSELEALVNISAYTYTYVYTYCIPIHVPIPVPVPTVYL